MASAALVHRDQPDGSRTSSRPVRQDLLATAPMGVALQAAEGHHPPKLTTSALHGYLTLTDRVLAFLEENNAPIVY